MFRRPRAREAVVSLEASASSKKPWTPPVEKTEEEAVRKEQVRPEESVSCVTDNFQAFISNEEMDGEESLQETVELVFKRAVKKPDSAGVFANLCQRLSTVEFQSLSDWSASVSFRSLLVKHCQAEFKKNFDREDISRKGVSCLEPVRDVRVIDRLREEKNNAKPSCRSINTIRFIGELFLSKVLDEKAMHYCIRKLLQNGDGPSLESLYDDSHNLDTVTLVVPVTPALMMLN
ncbi:eukaryotic translation initiation factor 4 gamma 3 [Pleuronectes platessa]|uniref:eukaryotic translation initiation factor 4 gamma 3 n=1 Tax=Pleuronectes platessa TaxID=8262 RepID=UPI00232A6DB1|nr:eukaryotic translation initiation factor 4 gamma 3 [Pleuronectes platessa]